MKSLLALLLALLLAAPAAAAPGLWVVRDADTEITIFGTMHALPAGEAWLVAPLTTRLDAADTLVMEIVLPGATIRVVDGAGQVTFGGEVYSGDDLVFGPLKAVESVTEQIGTEAPRVRFSFLPATFEGLSQLTDPAAQGSEVSLWFGAVSPETGLLIGTPELLFLGELDEAVVDYGTAVVVTLDVASAWERLFEAQEGTRLNNAFQQSLYPGDLGFAFVTEIQRQEPWGYDAPRPSVVADVSTPSSGGGGDVTGFSL